MRQIIDNYIKMKTDILVIGAGMAGICAAIQAARLGCDVIIVEKHSTLGGNAGPEVGVHPGGAHCYHPYAYETGIIGELKEEAAWCRAKTWTDGHHYNMSYQWDSILDRKLKDAGVRVLRNNYARKPIMERNYIKAVIVEDTETYETRIINVGTAVIESSGDGHIAKEAGAEFMFGRESYDQYSERSAPKNADSITLGSSLVALIRRTDGQTIDFIPPEDIPDFYPGYMASVSGWKDGKPGESRFFFPAETGGERDTILDAHEIRDSALKQLYSAWNEIKNIEFPEESINWELTWIGPRLAKRESRRFLGDYVLTQNDIEQGVVFPDSIAFGGFAIDVHDPKVEKPQYVTIKSYSIPPIYTIPYRCLYSKNISNLLFASRLISVTHIAHGTTRLISTLSTVGQAAGAAAYLCSKHNCTPRDIYLNYINELQQLLLKEDSTVIGVNNTDTTDLARKAKVTASSEESFNVDNLSEWLPLDKTRGIMLWDWGPFLENVYCYIKNINSNDIEIKYNLKLYRRSTKIKHHDDEFIKNKGFWYYKHKNRVEWGDDNTAEHFESTLSGNAIVPAGFEGWFEINLNSQLMEKDPTDDDTRYLFEIESSEGLFWGKNKCYYDFVRRVELEPKDDKYSSYPDSHMFTILPRPFYGEAKNIINGTNRRLSTNPVNMWISKHGEPMPQYLLFEWDKEQDFNMVQLTFDNIHRTHIEIPLDCGGRVSPMLVRNYRLEALEGDSWTVLCKVKDNYYRQRRHYFENVKTSRLRIVVESVWGHEYTARIYEVRVYNEAKNIPNINE